MKKLMLAPALAEMADDPCMYHPENKEMCQDCTTAYLVTTEEMRSLWEAGRDFGINDIIGSRHQTYTSAEWIEAQQ